MFKLSYLTDDELLNAMHHSPNETIQEIASRIEGIIQSAIEANVEKVNDADESYKRGYQDATEELL